MTVIAETRPSKEKGCQNSAERLEIANYSMKFGELGQEFTLSRIQNRSSTRGEFLDWELPLWKKFWFNIWKSEPVHVICKITKCARGHFDGSDRNFGD
jgi:hypothetical protein